MPEREKLPEALLEMVTRDGYTLEELAAHCGWHPSEMAKLYDLSGVPFPAESKRQQSAAE